MQIFMRELRARTQFPILLLLAIFLIGTFGFKLIGWEKWEILDCAFMTAITLTTVGYADVLQIHQDPAAMIFAMILMLVGMGIVLYCLSVITAFLVEEGYSVLFLEHKMLKAIEKMSGHYIVAGAGSVGEHVINELKTSGMDVVVIDSDEAALSTLQEEVGDFPYLKDDALQDSTLLNAGIERAVGLIACLPNDQDNLYLTVTCKLINPSVKVVARAVAPDVRAKMERVGADSVVSSNMIGGLRLASEVIRPSVVGFLDHMMRGRDHAVRISEIKLGDGSELAGVELGASHLNDRYNLLVLAVLMPGVKDYIYNPPPSTVLVSGVTLIVLGDVDKVSHARSTIS